MPLKLQPPRISLSNLKAAPGSLHNQKRVGRGQGSGYGRTSGRGTKGQNARSGPGPHVGFEGGQTPITKRFPKRGFYNQTTRTWSAVNLDRIQNWIDQGRLSSTPQNPITARELLRSGCIHNVHDGVKILANGSTHFHSRIYVISSRASKSAIKAIERQGGKVLCKYYNALALKDCVAGRTDRISAAPTRREDIVWYGQHANRGYLSPITLRKLNTMPFVENGWKELAEELGKWRIQHFDRQKKL